MFPFKLEACKECGETRFTVVSVLSVPAEIRKGRLHCFPTDNHCIASIICQACGHQHKEGDFRMAA